VSDYPKLGPNSAPPKYCIEPGCNEWALAGKARCDAHQKVKRPGTKHPTDKLYNVQFERLKKMLVSLGNVHCQRVNQGERCRYLGTKWHHILEAADYPAYFYEWQNLVYCCDGCHPRPHDDNQGVFTPTIYRAPMSSDPVPEALVQPGQMVSDSVVLWDRYNRLEYFQRMVSDSGN
jgi:hypothetical protein